MKQSLRNFGFIFTITDTLDDEIQKVSGSKSKGPLLYLTTIVCYFHKLLGSGFGRSTINEPTGCGTRH
jgi:hypothetical protein